MLKLLQNMSELFTQIKIKNLTKEQLIISFDRLTRFKFTEDKYVRVFKDIIISNLILPKFKKKDLEIMDYDCLRNFAVKIINSSLEKLFPNVKNDFIINKKIYDYENNIFNLSDEINTLLNNEINYRQVVKLIKESDVNNLLWLKSLSDDVNENNIYLKFPIRKLVLTEGITEEILLPVFSKILNFDFDKYGVQIISAGGKNQVVKLYYNMIQQTKLPIYILLDNDAKSNYEQILLKLRGTDKIHLLNGGEIEDVLPKPLILKTLNDYFMNFNLIDDSELEDERMVKNLEEIFKTKGFHDFKKSEFAQLIKNHIQSEEDISSEIKTIIKELSVGIT